MRDLLAVSNLEVDEIHIHSMVENVYFACVVATRRSLFRRERIEIDCRPSDGILVATYCERPIFVTEEIMQKNGLTPNELPQSQPQSISEHKKLADPYHDFWQNFIDVD